MEELLKEIGIDKLISIQDGKAVVDIDDERDYGRIYTLLDRSDLVEEDEESSMITMDSSSIQYDNDDYILTLIADFNLDEYKLVIKEV